MVSPGSLQKTVRLPLYYCPNTVVPINVNFFLLQYVGTSVENICMTSLAVRYFSTCTSSYFFFFEETGSRQTTWNIHCLQFGMYPIFLVYYFSLSTCLWPTQEYLVSASISSWTFIVNSFLSRQLRKESTVYITTHTYYNKVLFWHNSTVIFPSPWSQIQDVRLDYMNKEFPRSSMAFLYRIR